MSTLTEATLRSAVIGALEQAVKDAKANARADTFVALKALYAETGSKSLDVRLPDGTKVASISLSEAQPAPEVVDRDKFVAWAKEEHPEEVETVTRVREAFEKKVMDQAKKAGAAVTIDYETGEQKPVPGVQVNAPPAEPTGFSVRGLDKQAIAEAWQRGDIEPLSLIEPLAIGGSGA